MCVGLAEDTDSRVRLFQRIDKIVIERLVAVFGGQHDGARSCMFKFDFSNGQSQYGTQVKFKFRQVGAVAKGHHSGVVRTWGQLGEDDLALSGQEELYAPDAIARQCLGNLVGHVLCLLQCFFRDGIGLP